MGRSLIVLAFRDFEHLLGRQTAGRDTSARRGAKEKVRFQHGTMRHLRNCRVAACARKWALSVAPADGKTEIFPLLL